MSTEPGRRLWRVMNTVHKMLRKRGYVAVNQMPTWEEFKERFNPEMASYNISGYKEEDEEDKIWVFFNDDEKLGVKQITNYVALMEKTTTYRCIVASEGKLSGFAQNAMANYGPKFIFEHFAFDWLLFDITEHELVPQHIVLTEEQKKALLVRYYLKDSQLPRMQLTDPIALYYGLRRGQAVKIVRPSETAGRYVTYRIVW